MASSRSCGVSTWILINREADWSVRYGKNHIAVVNIRNQIRDIRRSMRDELGRIKETLKSDLQIAKKQQDDAEKGLNGLISQSTETNQAQVALFSLEAAAQSYRKLYDSFLQKHTETVQQQSIPSPMRACWYAGFDIEAWSAKAADFDAGFARWRDAAAPGLAPRENCWIVVSAPRTKSALF